MLHLSKSRLVDIPDPWTSLEPNPTAQAVTFSPTSANNSQFVRVEEGRGGQGPGDGARASGAGQRERVVGSLVPATLRSWRTWRRKR